MHSSCGLPNEAREYYLPRAREKAAAVMGSTYDLLSRKVGPSMELQALVTSLWAGLTVPCARKELQRSVRQLALEQTTFLRAMAKVAPDMYNISLQRVEEEALENSLSKTEIVRIYSAPLEISSIYGGRSHLCDHLRLPSN